jgi:hypothetical protein
MVDKLDTLAKSGVKSARDSAYQLLCSCQSSTFLVVLVIITKYSAMFEPVAQALQSVQLDLLEVQHHIQELLLF